MTAASTAGRAGWYARRLGAMGPAEVGWRAARAARAAAEPLARTPGDRRLVGGSADWSALLAAFRSGAGRPALLTRARAERIAAGDPARVERVLAAADRARAGRFAFLGHPEIELGREIDWHRDGPSGVRWPVAAGSRIDHRSGPADPKWTWELNRLQHLPWLAEAWLVTGEEAYAEAALAHLESWTAASPPYVGLAWRGGFEAGVRAISVALALQGLRDAPALTVERYRAAVRALWAMARRAWVERSLHSSANNHLVGELAGIAAVAVSHPELAAARRFEARAYRRLAREGARQVLADGAGAERTFAYQVFTGDLLLVAAALRRSVGRPVPRGILAALRRGAGYMAALLGDGDPAPRDGDDDDGFAVRLDADERRDPRGHLGAVAALTGDPAARRAGHLDLTARWLLGEAGERAWSATSPGPPAAPFVAPAGGLVVLREPGRRVTMDAGPLGYLAIAAHGHADALSVTMAVDGRDLVGDPGPGSYFARPDLRAAHRSTRAHATVTVDGLDQSVSGGPFLWTGHARARLLAADPAAGWAVAEHDGYLRLEDPVRHRRHLLMADHGGALVVDWLEAAGDHDHVTSWPLAPDLAIEPDEDGWRGLRDGAPALLIAAAATGALEPWAIRGDGDTVLGWWSEALEARRPAWLVGHRLRARGPAAVATLLLPAGGAAPSASVAVEVGGSALVVRHEAGGEAGEVEIALDRPWEPPTVRRLVAAGEER